MAEFERDHFRESLKSKDSVLKYLLTAAGDANYPVDIRRTTFDFRTDLERVHISELTRKASVADSASVHRVFDRLHQDIAHIRQMLLSHDLGDSELSHILSLIQENIRE